MLISSSLRGGTPMPSIVVSKWAKGYVSYYFLSPLVSYISVLTANVYSPYYISMV
jgi:hypothetical protein